MPARCPATVVSVAVVHTEALSCKLLEYRMRSMLFDARLDIIKTGQLQYYYKSYRTHIQRKLDQTPKLDNVKIGD